MSNTEFPVVGIGASAGGIEAFHAFFDNMPADCGMAFVMILHLPADRKSQLGEILRNWTVMPVVEAMDGTLIQADHVYVPPPHASVTLVGSTLRIAKPPSTTEGVFHPIDAFFDSLGGAMRERAIGIILSGTGHDGALGLKSIRKRGGLTIAQGSDGHAPQYKDMPEGAVAIGAVDLVVPVEQIPEQLLRLNGARREVEECDNAEGVVEAARLAICELLRTHLGHDFSGYRSQTFLRRVERRMAVTGATSIDVYAARLKSDPQEIVLLFRDLLIRVTSFFRDAETFETLARRVIPRLFEGKMADATVRVWVPGCATGEEAYSLSMLLREHMDTLPAPPKVQVFATDIDDAAIAIARVGRYPVSMLDDMSEERRQRFFTTTQGTCCIAKEIRDLCTFAVHNVVRDPPFSMMSLISCRNLLIYMSPELQAKVIPVFHYSLAPGGVLLLGGSESVAQHASLFDTVDKSARIFQRREGRSPAVDLRWSQPHLLASQRSDADPQLPRSAPRANAMSQIADIREIRARTDRIEQLLLPLPVSAESVEKLQRLLATTHQELQSLIEEHQTALEELRSANEELHSVNEEMQSSNEELETSKEELQSLNEELHTVNLRLTEKIEELDHSNSDLRNLFDSTEIATVFLDRHLIVRSFTPAIATIYNLIPSDQGRPLSDIVSNLRYDSLREDVAFVLSKLEPLERRVERPDGSVHYIMRILPYRAPDSTVTGVLVTFVDVTSIVEAETALVEADNRKDVFLATLSHELRNPLAPIRLAAQVMQSPSLEPGQLQEARDIIARQVKHMSRLLDDLLDVSRITRGLFLLRKAYIDVNALLTAAVESTKSHMQAKRHRLHVEYFDNRMRLEVDPVRVTQVITNLLTNAAKYTPPEGDIRLGVRLDANHLVIFVRDNGIGIPAEAMSRVFDMFARVASASSHDEGGLGIGLALAKGFIELHGGRIEVKSAGVGQGSEFQIRLPRSVMDGSISVVDAATDGVAAPAAPRRVLIADDNADSAETMAMLLQLAGHEVYVARNGVEALETASRVRPDVGIFDIGMPLLNGYELAERIRHEAWGSDITLIALTGWGQDSDRRRAYAAGFNHHLIKPADPEEIERLLSTKGRQTSRP